MNNQQEEGQKSKFQSKIFAILALLIACFILSFVPIFTKWSEQEISPTATVFDRFFITIIIFGLDNRFDFLQTQRTSNRSLGSQFNFRKTFLLLLGAGICSTISQMSWAWSITQTNISNSAFFHGLTPLFTTLFAWLFLARGCDRQFFIGMVIAIGGSIAIGLGDIQIATTKLQGDGLALLSAIFFGLYLLIVERLRQNLSVSSILFWRCLCCILFLLPILLFTHDQIMPTSETGWLAVAGLSLTFVIGHGLLIYTLNILSSSLVAVILLLDPFLSSLQAWIFFSEKLSLLEGISFAIVVLGVYLAISSRDRKIGVSE